MVLFDESHNFKTKTKQMDVHVRFWSSGVDCASVATRYLTSVYLGHSTADDLLDHFHAATDPLGLSKLVQVSMDGPAVNWKFHRLLKEELQHTNNKSIVDIGSCGLHIVHRAFQDGARKSGWGVVALLKALYYCFRHSPARREDLTRVTESSVFPLKFCQHRWVENLPVAERAVSVWSSFLVFVARVEDKTLKVPGCDSYDVIRRWSKDPAVLVKVKCFASIAREVQPFLVKFLTDCPMVPFLHSALESMLRSLLSRIVKQDTLSASSSTVRLMAINVTDESVLLPVTKVNMGFAAEEHARHLISGKKISQLQCRDLRAQCRDFGVALVVKLKEKSPLSFPLVRSASCLDPRKMAVSSGKEECMKLMKPVCAAFNEAGRVEGEEFGCEDILKEYSDFLSSVIPLKRSAYAAFDPTSADARIDHLLWTDMASNPRYAKLWKLVRDLLLLSHGQATVERGFSVNRQVEADNLSEAGFVARCSICDHVAAVGGIEHVDVSSSAILLAASSTRHVYQRHLDNQRREEQDTAQSRKRKAAEEEVGACRKKKKQLEDTISSLSLSADEFSEKAEQTGDLTWVSKSNSMRRTMKTKAAELASVVSELDSLVNAQRN